jgi:hypothetical protein
MPNHITNILTVSGSPEEVERFRVAVSTENPELIKLRIEKAKRTIKVYEEAEDKSTLGFYAESNYKNAKDIVESGKIPESVFTFEGTIPMPLELDGTVSGSSVPEWQEKNSEELKRKYGADNWYDFNINQYGTKWDAYSVQDLITNDDGSITYRFDTAWSPPSGWLEKTASMFPSLNLEDSWKDEGGGAGILTICIDEGIESYEELDDKKWYIQHDTDYAEELDFVVNGDYSEVIKKYAEQGEANYSYLNEDLIKRIKDEDLPLFMNYEWWGDDKDTYLERMEKIGHAVTE